MDYIAQFPVMNPHQLPFLNQQRTPDYCTAISRAEVFYLSCEMQFKWTMLLFYESLKFLMI